MMRRRGVGVLLAVLLGFAAPAGAADWRILAYPLAIADSLAVQSGLRVGGGAKIGGNSAIGGAATNMRLAVVGDNAASYAGIDFRDTGEAADAELFRWINSGGSFYLQSISDAYATQSTFLRLIRSTGEWNFGTGAPTGVAGVAHLYRNAADNIPVALIKQDHASASAPALLLENDGTAATLAVRATGGGGTNGQLLADWRQPSGSSAGKSRVQTTSNTNFSSAQVVLTTASVNLKGRFLVVGNQSIDGAVGWSEEVTTFFTATPAVAGTVENGSPLTRTYSVSSGDLLVQLSSTTAYDVTVFSLSID